MPSEIENHQAPGEAPIRQPVTDRNGDPVPFIHAEHRVIGRRAWERRPAVWSPAERVTKL